MGLLLFILTFLTDLLLLPSRKQHTLETYEANITSVINSIRIKAVDMLADSLPTVMLIDTLKSVNSLGLNVGDTSLKFRRFICGYIKIQTDADGVYHFGDSCIKLNKNGFGNVVYPYKILSSYEDSNYVMQELFKHMLREKYFETLADAEHIDMDCFTPPIYLKSEKWFFYFRKVRIEKNVFFNFWGIPTKIVKRYIDKIIDKNIEYTIQIKTPIKYAPFGTYLIGDSTITNNLLLGDNTIQFTNQFHYKSDLIITMRLTDNAILGLYSLFPIGYIFNILVSFIMYFSSKYFIRQVRKREHQLLSQHTKLVVSNRTKDRLFSIISHDLRNPITAMTNIAYIFDEYYRKMSIQDIEKSISMLVKATIHTGNMLENLLEWSRLNIGAIRYDVHNHNMGDIVDAVFADVESLLVEKDIKLEFNAGYIMQDVACDGDMILIVIRNLVCNAIKFSECGKKITITLQESEDSKYVVVSVCDEGVGMSPDQLQSLFSLSSSSRGTMGEKGTGLGLIICKELIDIHNCKIWAESEIGKGTQFKFTLLKSNKIE
jgi:signal transduction histidine kinase